MHEMSLVQNLFEQVKALAAENSANKVISVTMEIGPLCGVVVDSFQFGFAALSREDNLFREAELKITIPPVTYTCTNCQHVQESTREKPEECSECGELFLIPSGGNDLVLQQVEME